MKAPGRTTFRGLFVDRQERAFAVLGGLLTTVMGLAIKLEALDGPSAADREKQFRSGGAPAWGRGEDVIDPDR